MRLESNFPKLEEIIMHDLKSEKKNVDFGLQILVAYLFLLCILLFFMGPC